MKARILPTFGLVLSIALLLAVLPGGTLPTAAQEPEPPCPARLPSGSPLPSDTSPHRDCDETWYAPTGAAPPEEPPTFLSPQATGGPDDFGYTWDNSVSTAWIDATGGTDTGMSGDAWDQAAGPIPLPFPFKFYENTYNQVYIAAAGYLSFTDYGYWPEQQNPMPSQSSPNNLIAPFWTIIHLADTGPTGRVYYTSGGTAPHRYFVVEWFNVKGGTPQDSSGGDETYRFEVILYENGDILSQYHTMVYNDWRYYASIGIENTTGLDGLGYMDWDNYWARIPYSGEAVLFRYPAPQARVKVWPLHYGSFSRAGGTIDFEVPIVNTGELGSDTYDLFVSSPWPVGLYAADGTTPLTDTDLDGTVDTGSVFQGSSTTIVVKVTAPGTANVGDDNSAAITIRSSLDTGKSKTVSLQTAVPAPFTQVYRDDADGAMSLYLVQPGAQAVKKATSDGYYGYDVAVAEMPDSFAYFWDDYHWTGSVGTYEIEYSLLDRYGRTVRGVSNLTNHSGAAVNTYDYYPAVGVAPNGRIGVVWYRYRYNSSNYTWNYNIYYAILDASGNVVVPPTNLTNNPIWGYG
jgi:hypothetical protein